jgi:hypothetical protein
MSDDFVLNDPTDSDDDDYGIIKMGFIDGPFEVIIRYYYDMQIRKYYGYHNEPFTFKIYTRYGSRDVTIEKSMDYLIVTTDSKQLYTVKKGIQTDLKKEVPNLFKLDCSMDVRIMYKSQSGNIMEIRVCWPYRDNRERRMQYMQFIHQIKTTINGFNSTSKTSMFLSACALSTGKSYWANHVSSFI